MPGNSAVTPGDVIAQAIAGRLSKQALAGLLAPDARRGFYDGCSRIEQGYTSACRDLNDPCLDSGCAMVGEACLQSIQRVGGDFDKACGAEWATLFADAANRDPFWKATFASYEV